MKAIKRKRARLVFQVWVDGPRILRLDRKEPYQTREEAEGRIAELRAAGIVARWGTVSMPMEARRLVCEDQSRHWL